MKNVIVFGFQSLNGQSAGGTSKLAWHIAKHLNEQGSLDCLVISAKGPFDTPFPSSAVGRWSRYYLYIVNLLMRKGWLTEYRKRFIEEWLFDYFSCFWVRKDQSFLIATTPFLKRTFRKARQWGIPVVYVPGNPDENAIAERMQEEAGRWQARILDAYIYPRRIQYYNASMRSVSHILCFNDLMFETFRRYQTDGKIVRLVPGYVWEPPIPANPIIKRPASAGPVRFGYIGYTVLLKGVQNLLKAWQGIDPREARLIIAGPVDPSIRNLIEKYNLARSDISFLGLIRKPDEFYRNIDVLVVPSLFDSGPATLLEALCYGLPVVVSDQCGYAPLIRDKVNGFVFRADDLDDLRRKICFCLELQGQFDVQPPPPGVHVTLLAGEIIKSLGQT